MKIVCMIDLPSRYGLPCRCWLYHCIIDVIPIPISLIHPRWFFDGPPFVVSWRMVFDPTKSFVELFRRAAYRKTTEEQDEEADEGENAQQRQESEPEEEIEKVVDNNTGDRFRRGGVDLLHAAAHQSIDFHKSIKNVHRRGEYAREFAKFTAIFNKKNGMIRSWRSHLSLRLSPTKSDRRTTSCIKRVGVAGELTLAVRQLRQMKLSSDVLNVRTRLKKGGEEGMRMNCGQAVKTRV